MSFSYYKKDNSRSLDESASEKGHEQDFEGKGFGIDFYKKIGIYMIT